MGWLKPLIALKKNGTLIGIRQALNLIEGTGVTLTTADDVGNDEIDVTITSSGGGSGSGGGTALVEGFGEDNLAASLTNSQLYRNVQGIEAQLPVVMSRSGSIIGLSVAASEARTAGTATFEVYKDGVATGLTVVLNGTDTQYASTTQGVGVDTFVADERLDVRVTTDGSWAPTTSDVEATITVMDGSLAIPGWVNYLAARQSDETPHTDDLFFDGASGGTLQTVSGSATWTENYGLQSVVFDSQTNFDAAAKLWALSSPSSPMTIEVAIQAQLVDENTTTIALCFTDGTTTTSNVALARIFVSTSTQGLRLSAGTLTNITADVNDTVETPQPNWQNGLLYIRLAWTAANSFKAAWSSDGVSWTDFGASAQSKTMTPTHFGVFVSSGGSTQEQTAAFHYVRVATTDLVG